MTKRSPEKPAKGKTILIEEIEDEEEEASGECLGQSQTIS